MRERVLTVPDIMLIAGTRVALGVGIGLLVSRKLGEGARLGAGWALLAMGALTTFPLVMKGLSEPHASPERLSGAHSPAA
jgi:hypothetical protein